MSSNLENRRARLSIEVEPELRQRIKVAAAERDLSMRSYIETILRRALEEESAESTEGERWAGLSARSFARDWASKEDEAYDRLS